jgi:hypothetical protein
MPAQPSQSKSVKLNGPDIARIAKLHEAASYLLDAGDRPSSVTVRAAGLALVARWDEDGNVMVEVS